MNKRWLLSIALLVLVLPTVHICAMEEEATEEDSKELAEKNAQQIEDAPFLERVQTSGLPSPDGLLVARCTYKTSEFGDCVLAQEDLEQVTGFGFYPWTCFIKICMAEGAQKQVGEIEGPCTLLREMAWQDGNQLRILLTELTGVRQLKWHDYLYALDGTFLKNSMDDRLRKLMDRAASIPPTQ